MVVRNKKRVVRSKKKADREMQEKTIVPRRPKRAVTSKISILEESGLIGCLTGTGVTGMNYKDILC